MKIAVIDGQGGGIGKYITQRLRADLPDSLEIIALGTNSLATNAMLKAGANDGATGENAICLVSHQVDIIVGTLSIICANSFLGELTPKMAQCIVDAPAKKILLPLNRINILVIGASNEPLPHQVDFLVRQVQMLWEESVNV
ncbi:MAG: DUF3842 family protein [Bacillota bacterium]|jgi:hypothetical protein